MINSVRLTQIFVNDQDEALDFYVGKLGLELKVDADLGFMRWLTVGVPGEDREIFLEKPGGDRLRAPRPLRQPHPDRAAQLHRVVPRGRPGTSSSLEGCRALSRPRA